MRKNIYNSKLQVDDDDDYSVIEDILAGHRERFALLVNRYSSDVMHRVARIVSSQEDAEEVVQDTFVAVFRSLATYDREKASFKTWLMRIAYNASLKQLQSNAALQTVDMELEYLDSVPDTDVEQILNDTSSARLSLLGRAVKQLSAADQMLLSLYYHDDRPIKEIAYIMDRTEGYLRSRLQWIRKKLCQIIKTLEQHEKE